MDIVTAAIIGQSIVRRAEIRRLSVGEEKRGRGIAEY
jgi:hypothetical protein